MKIEKPILFPQVFQIISLARFGCEKVHDDRPDVNGDPCAVALPAFNARENFLFFQILAEMIPQRHDVAGGRAGGDNQIIRE